MLEHKNIKAFLIWKFLPDIQDVVRHIRAGKPNMQSFSSNVEKEASAHGCSPLM